MKKVLIGSGIFVGGMYLGHELTSRIALKRLDKLKPIMANMIKDVILKAIEMNEDGDIDEDELRKMVQDDLSFLDIAMR